MKKYCLLTQKGKFVKGSVSAEPARVIVTDNINEAILLGEEEAGLLAKTFLVLEAREVPPVLYNYSEGSFCDKLREHTTRVAKDLMPGEHPAFVFMTVKGNYLAPFSKSDVTYTVNINNAALSSTATPPGLGTNVIPIEVAVSFADHERKVRLVPLKGHTFHI